ncbi:uncharacterized protein RSE6_06649 [Rhynchosporium secalis]|uniref:Rhodopsin domain-containing protein n=1 Tax=Rhynchosporium secalis TaxID=38038 RepID=A0A1E1MAV4_RHYSE|nr:uncharacterized protein RSE6_06649 [Rhynchosporium secalis]
MASTTRTASDLANNGTAFAGAMGTRTDVLQSVDEVTAIVVMSILTPILCMKMFIKRYFGGHCVREDYALFCAWLSNMAYCAIALLMAHHGGGNHESEVPASDLVIFQQLLYANTIIYGPAAFLTKTSLLLIFARVFAHARRAVIFIYVLIGVMACYQVPILLLKIRICTPIQGLWDPSVEVVCFNRQSVFFTDAIVSVVTGAVVLLLPVPLVYTLKVNWCKRFRIAALLGFGGLSTIASVWRALFIWSPNTYEDITVTFVRINLLGIAEVSVGILAACLPTFNLLLTRYAKVRRTPTPACEIKGTATPECNIKRMTGMNLWKEGHKYGLNEVDGVDGGNGGRDDKGFDVEELDLKTRESSEAGSMKGNWQSHGDWSRYGEGRAGTPSVERKLPGHENENVSEMLERQKQRQGRQADIPDWPLPLRQKSVVSTSTAGNVV